MKRPVGVTILAILAIIGGLLSLIVAALGFLAAGVVASGALAGANVPANSTTVLAFSSGSLIVLGILYLAFGIGAFMLKGWAWTAGIIALVLGLISNIASPFIAGGGWTGSVIGIVVDLLLLYYLFRPNVRQAFGKGAAA